MLFNERYEEDSFFYLSFSFFLLFSFKEIFFLGLGVILFAIVGALSMASIENVPEDLIDNAAVFGALCLLTALVFIGDLLMSTPKKKNKHGMAELLTDKKGTFTLQKIIVLYMKKISNTNFTAKQQITTTLTTEKESKSPKMSSSKVSKKDDNGNINDGFDKVDEQRQKSSAKKEERRYSKEETYGHDEIDNFDREDGEPKEYTQNFENGRALRDSQMHRDSEMQKVGNRDSYKMAQRIEMPTMMYKMQDIYQRPVDEIDTPRFPIETNRKNETMFAKIVNPSVKIMKVERDVDEAIESYR